MLRSLLALLMILLAAPAYAGSRFGGFHGGGFPAFHPSGGLVLGFFGSYFCGYNCGLGFYNPAYGYFNGYAYAYGYGYGYLYGSGYGNSYFNGYGYFNRYGYFNGYSNGDRFGSGNGYGYGSGAGNAASISNGLTGGYVPDPVGADIPPLIIPKNCWVRRAAYDPSGAHFGQVLVNLCLHSDSVTVTGLRTRPKMPDAGPGTAQPPPLYRSDDPKSPQ
jgi:hypothetical protein